MIALIFVAILLYSVGILNEYCLLGAIALIFILGLFAIHPFVGVVGIIVFVIWVYKNLFC